MPISPSQNGDGLVTLTVLSSGQAIDSSVQVLSILVESGPGAEAYAVIRVVDGNPATGNFPVLYSKTFRPLTPIEIRAGYDDASGGTLYKGPVAQVCIKSDSDQGSYLEIRCLTATSTTSATGAPLPTSKPDLQVTYGDDVLSFEITSDDSKLKKSRGSISFQGSALAKAGGAISIRGFGTVGDGIYKIDQVRHEIAEGAWTTEVDFSGPL